MPAHVLFSTQNLVKSKKRSSRPQMPSFSSKFSGEQKKVFTTADVLFFSQSLAKSKMKVFVLQWRFVWPNWPGPSKHDGPRYFVSPAPPQRPW